MKLLGLLSMVLAWPVWATAPAGLQVTWLRQELTQGGFVLGVAPSGTLLSVAGQPVPVGPDGRFVVGFHRQQGPKVWLKACHESAPEVCRVTTLNIVSRTYRRQNVTRIARKHVTPDPAQVARTKADSAATRAARQTILAQALIKPLTIPQGWFQKPVEGPLTGVFGSQRLYNGEERSWHNGVDWAGPIGTPVVAPADGVVRLTRDTFMSGKLVLVDHGLGISTVYAHLHTIDVQPGQRVRTGEKLGTLGNTGRSSGPHLHWGVFWGETALDPLLWLAPKDRT